MQIAQVVVKTRTQKEEIFDYAIPPEILPGIKIGVLVEVPFHGRKLEGIIVKLNLKSQISNLKSIISIIDLNPVVDEIHIILAKWMADYYLTSLGKTLFENIVPPAKRTIKKFENYGKINLEKVSKKNQFKKYLLVADFRNRLKFYLAAIEKTLKQKLNIIILIPDLTLIQYFTKSLKKYRVSIIHSNLSKTERWLEFNKIRDGGIQIVVGSKSALFAPLNNIGLIIIDQEENATYKNDRSPRYQATTTAGVLAKLARANLILGSLTPRIETYYQTTLGSYYLKYSKPSKQPMVSIVDMNSEKYIISNPLEREIDYNFKNHQKSLLVLNRKGEGTKFSCPDCNWIALCEKCGLPLIPEETSNVCFRCQKKYFVPEKCPKCQNVHLKPRGIGTARIKKYLEDIYPEAKIIRIEKDIDENLVNQKWDIAVVTNYALKFQFPALGLVAIMDADQGLNFPDFYAAEKNFANLYKFLKIGERGVIQTNLPESDFIKNLAEQDYQKFFLDEIILRQKFAFPPYTRLIRLLSVNSDETVAKNQAQNIYSQLKDLSKNITLKISSPAPTFIFQKREKYRFQIIIKTSPNHIPTSLKTFLRSLPYPWIVDVDPVDLL